MASSTELASDFGGGVEAVRSGGDPIDVARRIAAGMTEDERLWCLDGDSPFWAGLGFLAGGGYHMLPFDAARVDRVGIPGFAFADGPRGVVVDHATCFPVSMARGATWDPLLEERIGEVIGAELRAIGANLYGGVCVNILRHPAWGRAQETYGEDPHHVGELGAALTRGVQRHAMACVKHFACNSMENARFKIDVTVDEAALHEVYLPHFKRIIDEGVAVVMSAYNRVNGEWCGESAELLTDILRQEWGFDGFVISDWIFGLRDAGRSVAAGLDVEMPYRMVRASHLRDALDAGTCTWDDVDAAVVRLVSTLLRQADLLGRPAEPRTVLATPAHRALAREAGAKAVVLLRNESVDGAPLLPLTGIGSGGVAVLGRLADLVNLGDAGSSDVWAPEAVTIAEGLRRALPDVPVAGESGVDLHAAADAARRADVAVVVVGYTHEDEGEYIGAVDDAASALYPGPDDPQLAAAFEAGVASVAIEPPAHVAARDSKMFGIGGDRTSLRLHEAEVELIRAVAAANPKTVVAIVAGSAVIMSEWIDAVPAVVVPWYGGMEAGHALADVLLGVIEPTGRLPFSIPTDESHLPCFDREAEAIVYDEWHGWWKLDRDGHVPMFPFGFGLAYTTFALAGASMAGDPDEVAVDVQVENTGGRAGTDLCLVFSRRRGSDRPARLAGFARVAVEPGATATVRAVLRLEALHERDVDTHTMGLVPGTYDLSVARHAADPRAIRLEAELG